MSRLTVRLPNVLHAQLNSLATSEGVSLNQYIVYALTRQATLDQARHDAHSTAGHTHTVPHLPQALDSLQAMSSETTPGDAVDPGSREDHPPDHFPPPIQTQE